MRVLTSLKWTQRLRRYFVNRGIVEYKWLDCRAINCRSHNFFSTQHPSARELFFDIVARAYYRNFSTTQSLSKSKDKEKKQKGGKAQLVDENELGQIIDIQDLASNLEKAVADLKASFIKHLTVRSATGSIEQLNLTFDGQEYILQELVEISRKPKTVVLNVSSFPQAIPKILETLQKSGMNLNPQQDGTTIFIPIPKVTKEHRESLSKNAKALFIRSRDVIKDIRNQEIKKLKKKPSLSEDTARRIQMQIEVFSDRYIKEAEKILETKQKELLGTTD